MLDTKHRGRRKGITVREGSVRQAREEAGLSLAEVANGRITRTAIHLIEHGRTRPSLETLRHIAQRTRKPIEFFLATEDAVELADVPVELLEVERLSLMREFDVAIKAGMDLLDRRWNANHRALLHFYLGHAFCELVRPDDALDHLRAARRRFEQTRDEWMAVEALDWEATALGYLDDPEALRLATEALDRCRKLEPKPPQTESRILGHIASMYVVRQSWAQAVRYYQAAVEAAGGMKDLRQQAKMHHGLGAAYQRMMQPAKARQHFDRALALYSIESDLSAVYRVENDLGYLLVQQGQLDSAEDHLQKALAGSRELEIDRRGRGFILTSLGELYLRKGQLEFARRYLDDALNAGKASNERIVLGEAHTLLGKLEEVEGNPKAADRHFSKAISIYEELNMPDRLRDCHMDYAEVMTLRKDISSAANHWKLAAEIGKLTSQGVRLSTATARGRTPTFVATGGPAA